MTSAHSARLLSLEEWDALPEDNSARIELQEGVLIVSPKPQRRHQRAAARIWKQLDSQLPLGFEALLDFEIVVEAEFPATVRVPDVVVTRSDGPDKRVAAAEVVIAIEIVSPGSRRTDTVTKRSEYAEAGIPHYRIVDLDEPATLTALHLAGDFGYQEAPAVSGSFTTAEPFALTLQLDGLADAR
ncbi:Uma2 family endonuclease [Hoyosella altamirensis]|uniref:Uma2 family endonuclease n=1 Tax=Hoyosella altamirensis TaxID=616997 RepID=A0A839RMI8_9ACTN|nr:Uma2 family endonuclease [Hoyosella altamirensis]MBB3037955.1 Uma2 family endonuclease [Hoyosella altamirensis]